MLYRGYYFLKYADKAKPLHKITEKNQKCVWTQDCQYSFEELKKALTRAPILAYTWVSGNSTFTDYLS
jgi:hypothetical protein